MPLAPLFQDHAVLQRDVPLPIWSTAAPGTQITVNLATHAAITTTSTDGRWLLRLPALPVGGPHTLTASAEGQPTQTCHDILIGEVWIGTGQSNMEYIPSAVDPAGVQSRDTHLPNIRLLKVATPAAAGPQTDVAGQWQAATPHSLAHFSARFDTDEPIL